MVVILIVGIVALLISTGTWFSVLGQISSMFPEGFWTAYWADIQADFGFYLFTVIGALLIGVCVGAARK